MALTTFGEEVYLRALTGRYVGEYVLREYNKVVVISLKNIICSSISAATEAVYVMTTGGRARHIFFEGDSEMLKKNLEDFDPDAVVFMFGGETPFDEVKRLFVEALNAAAEMNYEGDLIFHVRIFAGGGLDEALKNEKIKHYLMDQGGIVYTVDLDQGLFIINYIYVTEEGYTLERIEDYPVTAEHADLLNRSLRDKRLKWE